MTIKFQNPPINELIITTYFNPPISNLRNEHIGIFWSRINQDFPESSQQIPIGGAEQIVDVQNEISPMPRYWFISKEKTNLLQVQKNAFMLNWRRRETNYPRFSAGLKPVFDKYFSVFSEFIHNHTDTSDLTIDLCQLTYINVIKCCEYWSGPEDTQHVIPSFSLPVSRIMSSSASAFNCSYIFEVLPNLQLIVRVRTIVTPSESGGPEPILIVEIQANGRLGKADKLKTDPWFDDAHELINKCFIEITNPEIQRQYWKPVEEAK
ncbi:MAG: TIGR04255 family protein [Candidatus Dadabacteria bacterium]|nr:TIGR04255 family protein [Candidatus Dadabacteria bacterium]